jgi:hypothetical protein
MSSATPSRPAPFATDDRSTVAAWTKRFVSGVRATAFWSAAVLPLVVIAAMAAVPVGQYPAILAGALALNVICAVVGHEHTPGGDPS